MFSTCNDCRAHLPEHLCECISLLIKSWSAVNAQKKQRRPPLNCCRHPHQLLLWLLPRLTFSPFALWHGTKLVAIWETLPTATGAWISVLLRRLEQEGCAHPVVDPTRLELSLPEDARWQTPLPWLLDLLKLSRRTEIRGFPLLSAGKEGLRLLSSKKKKKWDLCTRSWFFHHWKNPPKKHKRGG